MNRQIISTLALLTAACAAQAQQGWVLQADRTVLTPSHPSTVVTLLATHAPDDYAFAGAGLDVLIEPSLHLVYYDVAFNCGIGPCPGGITPRGIEGLIFGQLHFPPPIYADPRSPLESLYCMLETTPTHPGAGQCLIQTETRKFDVYPFREQSISEPRTAAETRIVISFTDCEADCDADGELTLFDFLCFQNLFAADDGYADCDSSGELDFADFLCFQNNFAAGCP